MLGRSSTDTADASQVGAGTVAIDGRVYPFAPETCVITDDGFVASGPGTWGDQSYVASVSQKGGVQVAFGVSKDVDRPEPGQQWWVAPKFGRSRIKGSNVHATATVEDRSGSTSGPRSAVVHLTCPDRS